MMHFIDPTSGNPLVQREDRWCDSVTGAEVAKLVDGIPRFVQDQEDYAKNFGFQWNTWHSAQSQTRSNFDHAAVLKERSGLWDEGVELEGKSLLECGMGGGDDTEMLLTLPLAEIHAFDISRSVERAAKYLSDDRLTISQASIFEIPYPPESFDFVWCHRVIQHTPDPERALRCVCKMVKPGGFLFAHSYKRSRKHMREFRYKYRPITTRMPQLWIYRFLNWFGAPLHDLQTLLGLTSLSRELGRQWVPFYKCSRQQTEGMSRAEIIDFERLITFDALTPQFDLPMTTEKFTGILADEDFEVTWLFDPEVSPVIARAVKHP